MKAVKQNGLALAYASERKRNNKATVLTAINQNWRAFQFASKGLKKDDEVVNSALLGAHSSKKFLRKGFKNDCVLTPEALFTEEQFINFFSDEKQMKLLKEKIGETANGLVNNFKGNEKEHAKFAITIRAFTKNSLEEIKKLQKKYKVSPTHNTPPQYFDCMFH